MSSPDISRYLLAPARHYGGVRLQQGRAILDSDFNEEALADDEEQRRIFSEVVGASGSPNDGFLPELSNGQTVLAELVFFGGFFAEFVLNFGLSPGSMYLGGMRFELEASEPVVFQKDFLQMTPADAPLAAVGNRRQLVYLRAFEQCVTAVEDEEILEAAMGGADGMVRVRRTRRVEVRTVEADEPADALAEVVSALTEGEGATFDPATGELRSNARLRIGFTAPPTGECPPCEPALTGRYLGGENHTLRIMLATPTSYVWAFEDAAPLYRVKIFLHGPGLARVEMLTPPKDRFHAPSENTVVEFLPWSVLLDNGEKAAGIIGFFGEVETPFSDGDQSFQVRLTPSANVGLGAFASKVSPQKSKIKAKQRVKTGGADRFGVISVRWDPKHPQAAELNPASSGGAGVVAFVYMRVWQKRPSGDAPLFVPTSSTDALGRTGLVPIFSGQGRPGDYWVVAVRPSAPTEVVPRNLLAPGGVPPHGPREFLAPISLIEWQSAIGFIATVASIRDVRPRFSPIVRGDCCTLVVAKEGGGFSSIQAAIDALPVSGGRICIRRGVYEEELFLDGRSHVVIEGCGTDTVLRTPGATTGDSLVQILGPSEGDTSIVVRKLRLQAFGQTGILASGERITLSDLEIETGPAEGVATLPAITIVDGRDIRIVENRLVMDGSRSDHAAIYLEVPALGALVENNRIETLSNQGEGECFAWGGLQLAGGATAVEVRRNQIIGGRGHGITLGSVTFRSTDGRVLFRQGAGAGQSSDDSPFDVTGDILPIVVDETTYYPDLDGGLSDLLVTENRILGTSNSGISVLALSIEHGDIEKGPPLCLVETLIHLERITIADNEIAGNLARPPSEALLPHVVGGIVLSQATDLTVRGNLVEGNGAFASVPVSGIFVASADRAVIDGNQVRGNGRTAASSEASELRGGIVVFPAGTEAVGDGTDLSALSRRVFVRHNLVESPEGPAIALLSRGQCAIVGNHLSSSGDHVPTLSGVGSTALVLDIGRPLEAPDPGSTEPDPARWHVSEAALGYLRGLAQQAVAGGGGLLFNDNVVVGNFKDGRGATAAVFVESTDHLGFKGNQISLESGGASYSYDALTIGFTTAFAKNRFSETIEGATASALSVSFGLNATVYNISTHCLFALAGSTAAADLANRGNLVLLVPVEVGCTLGESPFPDFGRGPG